jgi:hypothetical protein
LGRGVRMWLSIEKFGARGCCYVEADQGGIFGAMNGLDVVCIGVRSGSSSQAKFPHTNYEGFETSHRFNFFGSGRHY